MPEIRWTAAPTEAELATAAAVCVSALFGDPVQRGFFRSSRDLARAFVVARSRSGALAIADGGLGVAAWHAHASPGDLEAVREASARFGEAGAAMFACFEDVGRSASSLIAEALQYERKLAASLADAGRTADPLLVLLAVEPAHQGRGIGSALLRAGLERFPAAALSTEDERGVRFYERFGLRVHDTFETEGDTTWVMTISPTTLCNRHV